MKPLRLLSFFKRNFKGRYALSSRLSSFLLKSVALFLKFLSPSLSPLPPLSLSSSLSLTLSHSLTFRVETNFYVTSSHLFNSRMKNKKWYFFISFQTVSSTKQTLCIPLVREGTLFYKKKRYVLFGDFFYIRVV